MVLAVLAPYRGRGIGSALLRASLRALDAGALPGAPAEAALHVHEGNAEALAFYARFGFAAAGRVENYYKRIDAPHAVLLVRAAQPAAAAAAAADAAPAAAPAAAAPATQ